jgi:hypothetical protein
MTTYVYGDQTPKNSKIHDGFKGNQTFFGETIDLGHLIQTLSIKRLIGYNERYKEVIGNNGGERQKNGSVLLDKKHTLYIWPPYLTVGADSHAQKFQGKWPEVPGQLLTRTNHNRKLNAMKICKARTPKVIKSFTLKFHESNKC